MEKIIIKEYSGKSLLNGDLVFETENGKELKIDSDSALEIAMTLFDCYGLDFDSLYDLEEKIEEKKEKNANKFILD